MYPEHHLLEILQVERDSQEKKLWKSLHIKDSEETSSKDLLKFVLSKFLHTMYILMLTMEHIHINIYMYIILQNIL